MMRRILPLALPLVMCSACDDELETLHAREAIEPTTARCSTVEIVPMDRPKRFVSMDEGRFAFWGTRPPTAVNRPPDGHVIVVDPASPTGPYQPMADDNRIISALTWHEGMFWTSLNRPIIYRTPEESSVWSTAPYALIRTSLSGVGPDLAVLPDRDVLITYRVTAVQRHSALVRFNQGFKPVWQAGLLDAQGQPMFDADFRSFVLDGDDVYLIGVSRNTDQPDELSFIERIDLESGRSQARRVGPRRDVEPMRLVRDEGGQPVLLGIEGHAGDRYERGQPFAAHINPDAELVGRRFIPLPDDAAHGALLAAVDLGDGWIYGGSACGTGRSWCDAWLVRTRGEEVVWSRRLVRSVAATVTDIRVEQDRVIALVASSRYCCEHLNIDHDAWIWELDLEGDCRADSLFPRDGRLFR